LKDDNVVELAAYRDGANSEQAVSPSASRSADRSKEAMDILKELRRKARIHPDDRPIVARNLGRLLVEMEPDSPKLLAKKVLQSSWQKRKRYIHLPSDHVGGAPVSYAASGLEFAGIIERLAEERIRAGFDRTQAIVATIYDVLKETSFRRPSRFQIREGFNESEAALLLSAMKQVFDKFAQEVELSEYFELVSKYPVFPDCPYYESSNVLALDGEYVGNDIYRWDWMTDEDEIDVQSHIPWWAPRCVIGHLYIPFQTDCLYLPEQGITELRDACGGEITRVTWNNEYSELVQPFITPEYIRPQAVHYRFPVVLVGLPRPNRLVPCLYGSLSHPTGLQKDQWASYSQETPDMPCIAAGIGGTIDEDDVFFYGSYSDPKTPLYVCVEKAGVLVMGSEINGDEFTPNLWLASSIDDLPNWLNSHPVQRFLKLSPDSDLGTQFALTQRRFLQREFWFSESDTVFRPSFPDSSTTFTQLRSNTIGAYLLRNFADNGGIFEFLKSDALEKIAATKKVINTELRKTQDAFDRLYGDEVSQDQQP
jgi:hypothetical protein